MVKQFLRVSSFLEIPLEYSNLKVILHYWPTLREEHGSTSPSPIFGREGPLA
jgi:hypothetical protein